LSRGNVAAFAHSLVYYWTSTDRCCMIGSVGKLSLSLHIIFIFIGLTAVEWVKGKQLTSHGFGAETVLFATRKGGSVWCSIWCGDLC
jgi:hypothetical protein